MTRISDPIRRSAKSNSLDKLHRIIEEGLIGKKCWKVIFNSGDLSLHMGARLSYHNPKMAGERKGEWIFGTCGTRWVLITPQETFRSGEEDEEKTEQRAKAIENSRVTGFGVSVPDNVLLMDFSNNCRLLVIPTPADAKYDLPYWELFMPNEKFVAFGPGPTWSYRRADLPER